MKTAAKKAEATPAQVEEQVQGFIDKFDEKNQALIRSVRKALRKRFSTAHELVYDNYNFFVIGYSPTERPTDAILSMAAGANGVGLCFGLRDEAARPAWDPARLGIEESVCAAAVGGDIVAARSGRSDRPGHRNL